MAKRKVWSKMDVVGRSVRPLRKQLLNEARKGNRGVVLIGNRTTGYVVAVNRGNSLVICSQNFNHQKLAEFWNKRKTGQKLSLRKQNVEMIAA